MHRGVSSLALAVTVALGALLAAVAAPATAKSTHGRSVELPWVGQYTAQIVGGTQSNDWTLNHPDGGACDVSETGNGSEHDDYQPGNVLTVTVIGNPGGTAFLPPMQGLRSHVLVNRSATFNEGPDDGDDGPDNCPSGDAAGTPIMIDCGASSTDVSLDILPGADPPYQVSDGFDIAQPFQNCGALGSALPGFPLHGSADTLISPIGPAPRYPPFVDVHVLGDELGSGGDATWTSKLDLTVRLTRILTTDALGVADNRRTIVLTRSGDANITVKCPAGGDCSGILALYIDTSATTQSVRDPRARSAATGKPPAFPRAFDDTGPKIAGAHFHIRGGHRQVVRIPVPGGRRVIRNYRPLDFDLVVQSGRGRRSLRYVIATRRLR